MIDAFVLALDQGVPNLRAHVMAGFLPELAAVLLVDSLKQTPQLRKFLQ